MTVRELIYDGLRLCGVMETGHKQSNAENTELLRALNNMLDAWRTERLMAYTIVTTQYVADAGGFVQFPRTVRVEGVWVVDESVSMMAAGRMLTNQTKYLGGIYCDQKYPTSTLTFNPPIPAGNRVLVETWMELPAFTSLDQVVAVPQGYVEAIQYGLALRVWPRYRDGMVHPLVLQEARESKANIKRMNAETPLLMLDRALLGGDMQVQPAGDWVAVPVLPEPPPTPPDTEQPTWGGISTAQTWGNATGTWGDPTGDSGGDVQSPSWAGKQGTWGNTTGTWGTG